MRWVEAGHELVRWPDGELWWSPLLLSTLSSWLLLLLTGVIGLWIIASIWVVLSIVISALSGWPGHLAPRLRHRSRRL